jgi:hypothetical protein
MLMKIAGQLLAQALIPLGTVARDHGMLEQLLLDGLGKFRPELDHGAAQRLLEIPISMRRRPRRHFIRPCDQSQAFPAGRL